MIKVFTTVTAIFLSGCIGTTQAPMKDYTFQCNDVDIKTSSKPKYDKILKIALPNSLSALSRRSIVYSLHGSKIGNYAYSQWIDTPSELLQNIFLRTLTASNLFKAVLSPASSAKSDLLLESEILQFIHDVEKKSVKIKIFMVLLDQRSKTLIKSKLFSYEQKVEEQSAKGAVDAFNIVLAQLQNELLLWLEE